MNDKEYTYDIDKYTIGVDENGEDGIGMTIAIIKNGEINFLGNCYGENARCIDLLIKENQELNKQLEDISEELELVRCDLHNRTSERDGYERELNECLSQQKEFINYLEKRYKDITSVIGSYGSNTDMLYGKKDILEEIFQEFKSIIGDDK